MGSRRANRRPSSRCREWKEGRVVFIFLKENAHGASCRSRVSSTSARVMVKHDAVELFRNECKKDLVFHAVADTREAVHTTLFNGDGVSVSRDFQFEGVGACPVFS